jgi:hypothetical protein
MLAIPPVIRAGSFVDMLDAAFRFYRLYFLAFWKVSAVLWAATLTLQFAASLVLSSYWIVYLLVFSLTFAYASCQQISLIKILVDPSCSNIVTPYVSLRQWWAAWLVHISRLIMLVVPIALVYGLLLLNEFAHRNDAPPMGSADTPEEQAAIWLFLVFIFTYPWWVLLILAGCRLAVPALVLNCATPARALRTSWGMGRTAFHHVLLTNLLISVIYMITQLPTLILVQMNAVALSLEPSFDSFLLSAALHFGISLALPISFILEVFLYLRLQSRVTAPTPIPDAMI